VINGALYAVMGGATEVYDPVADRWTAKAPLTGLSPMQSIEGTGINGVLYVAYGGDALNVRAYDPVRDSWNERSALQAFEYGISGFGAAAANGILYAMGGSDVDGNATAANGYDPVADRWSGALTPPPIHTEGYPGVAALNGRLYVVGGADYFGSALATVQVYNPAADSWTSRAPMPTPRFNPAVAVLNGMIYAIGGGTSNVPLGAVEAYDPATDNWTSKPSLPTPRWGLGVGVVNGVLYAVGGVNSGGTVEAYKP
jgi:N-acetylneuraminic acid mutarotase